MPAEFNPVAKVIDTYTPPSAPTLGGPTINAGGGWQDLARSLARFNSSLMGLLEGVHDQLVEEELAEGARIQQEHQVAFKEAVKQGLIPEGANPYLKLGYLRSELRQKGHEYRAFLMEEWSKDGAIQNAEVDAIVDWAAAKTAEWRQVNLAGYSDKLVAEVFDPVQQAAQNQLMQHHIGMSFERTSQKARENLETEIAAVVTDAATRPGVELAQALGTTIRDERELRVQFVATYVQTLIDEAIANGMAPADANQIAINQIAAIAELRGDRSLLNALDRIKAGSGAPLGNTTAAKIAKLRVDERIAAREEHEEDLFWKRRERERSEQRRAAMNAAIDMLAEQLRSTDGVASIDVISLYESLGVDDPGLMFDLMRLADGMIASVDREVPTDGVFVSELRLEMLTNPDFDPLKIHAGLTSNRYGWRVMQQLYDDYAASRDIAKDPRLNSPLIKALQEGVGKSAVDPVSQGFGAGGLNRANAELEFRMAIIDFVRKNPDATEAEVVEYGREIAPKIVKHYNELAMTEVRTPGALQSMEQAQAPAPTVTAEPPAPVSPPSVAEQIAAEPEQPAAEAAPAEQPVVTFEDGGIQIFPGGPSQIAEAVQRGLNAMAVAPVQGAEMLGIRDRGEGSLLDRSRQVIDLSPRRPRPSPERVRQLRREFDEAPDLATKASVMDAFDAEFGPQAAAKALGFIE